MESLGSGAAVLDLLFQIGSYRSILFDFGTDISTWTFEFYLKKNKGDRLKTLSLTLGSGLSFPVYESDQIQATFSSANTSIQEGQYYYELRRTDIALPLINGFAYFSFDAPQGTIDDTTLELTVLQQTISVTISNISDVLDHFRGVYPTLIALQTAVPTGNAGDYADVDAGVGTDVQRYIWDVDDAVWILGGGAPLTLTDGNGTTANGTAVDLGGGVIQNTDVNSNDKALSFVASANGGYVQLSSLDKATYVGVVKDPTGDYVSVASSNLSNTELIAITINAELGGAVIEDTRNVKLGLQTAASGYVTSPRSYSDKEYVDSVVVGLQQQNNNLSALSGLTGAADRMFYFTGVGAMSLATLSAFARTILDDADAAAMRDTLGVNPFYKNNVPFSHTGNTDETVMDAACLIPGGIAGSNDTIRVTILQTKAGTLGINTIKLKANTTPVIAGATQILQRNNGGSDPWTKIERGIEFQGSVSSQIVLAAAATTMNSDIVTLASAPTILSIDFAVDQYIFPTFQLANAGDTATLRSFMVEIIKG